MLPIGRIPLCHTASCFLSTPGWTPPSLCVSAMACLSPLLILPGSDRPHTSLPHCFPLPLPSGSPPSPTFLFDLTRLGSVAPPPTATSPPPGASVVDIYAPDRSYTTLPYRFLLPSALVDPPPSLCLGHGIASPTFLILPGSDRPCPTLPYCFPLPLPPGSLPSPILLILPGSDR